MVSMGTLFLRIRIMSDMSDFCGIIWLMSNSDNIENRIRIHPSDIHIKNEYEYGCILIFLAYTNTDNSDFQVSESIHTARRCGLGAQQQACGRGGSERTASKRPSETVRARRGFFLMLI
jgi:hypothetical protein